VIVARHDAEVAVVGGGPGGSCAALAAARAGLRVLLFEPQRGALDKPCGEGILPAGVDVLEALGLPLDGLPLERIRYVLARGRTLEVAFPRAGRAIERPELMRRLGSAVEAQDGISRIACRVDCAREQDGFALWTRDGRWKARTLIAADGLQGGTAAWLRGARARGRRPHRIGLRARFAARTPLEHVEVHLGTDGEVYLTPLPGGRVNVAILRDGLPARDHGARALLARALETHPAAREHLGAEQTAPALRLLERSAPVATAGAGAFLVGDATGGIDPVLGCGVALALTTGLMAGRAAAQVCAHGPGAPERAYARAVARETRLRRRVAGGLVFLAAHPLLQGGVAWTLRHAPGLGRRLAAAVAGDPPLPRP
jgi:flavin-dependent dehydrogenase